MAITKKLAQSVSDATRFTATTPHAWSAAAAASVRRATSSQAAYASSSSSSSSSNNNNKNTRFQSPAGGSKAASSPAAQAQQASRRGPAPPGAGGPRPSPASRSPAAAPIAGETPEQKVARLRAAHQAAKNAQVSSVDRVISGTRRVFDNAHRFTIIGLIGFTGRLFSVVHVSRVALHTR